MRSHFCLLALLCLCLFSLCAAAADPSLTDPDVARQLGITVQQLHGLHSQYALDNDELLNLPPNQLQILLSDLEHPGQRHQKEHEFRALKMMDEHGHIPPDGLLRALEQSHRHIKTDTDLTPGQPDPSTNEPTFGDSTPLIAGLQTNAWTWLGPGNIGGRVRAILPHPSNASILWCGGVDGGIWKTLNAGSSWFPLNDFMGNLAVACLAMDPTNADILYAGTGEGTYNIDAVRGAGIFKSTDGGTNWFRLSGTTGSSFQYVGRISLDPFNSLTLLAATRSGIWRSVNGGTNWTQRLTTEVLCVAFNPTNSAQAIASGYNGSAFYSNDGGQTWLAATGIPTVSGFVVDRVELAYSRTNPAIVFASVDNSSGQVYRSLDGGHTYTLRNTGNNYLGGQGWYDNFVWADPINTNVVIVGGLDVWRSTDGGLTFTDIGGYSGSIHPDQHVLAASTFYNGTTIRTIFVGNDGGVFRASDAYTASSSSGWATLNHNLGITQFYGGAGNSNTSIIIGGTQDNGTLRYSPGGGPQGWTSMFGGDGGQCASDPTNSNYFYGEYVDLQIHRSANGGLSASYIYSGITDAGNNANFIAPFILDPNNPNTMLAGGASLWRSTNVKAATPTWTAIKPAIGSPISAIAVAPGNSDVIFVGHNSGAVYYTANGTAASPTWSLRNTGLPARYCTSLTVATNGRAYATFGGFNTGNVLMSANSGLSWGNISANLPAAPMNSLVVAPFDPSTFYVGSEVGVYGTSTGGSTWSTGNEGPANVAVDQLFWLGSKLIAVTHGRGMFSIVPAVGTPALANAGFTLNDANGNGAVDPNECGQLLLFIRNTNGPTATNVTATLTTSTPGVVIVQGTSTYPNIPLNTTVTNLTPFRFNTSAGYVCGSSVNLILTVAANGTNSVLSYTLPGAGSYLLVQTNAVAIIPGTTDTGNHGQNVLTPISLPFPVTYYGSTFTNATLCSNGNLQFLSANFAVGGVCLPVSGLNYAIFPFWDNLRTDLGTDGIYTSVSGTAPNRTFNIEWQAALVSSSAEVDFEIVLYENQARVDLIYGALGDPGSTATVGIQRDTGSAYNNFECSAGGLTTGLQLSYQWQCSDGGGLCPPIPNFAATPTSGPVPLTVNFTNLTQAASVYAWDFGDGGTSAAANPANTYSSAGTYTVTLTATGAGGTVALTRTNYILVTNVPPVVTTPPLNQSVPVGVAATFTVAATGTAPLSYQWRASGTPISGATGTSYTVPAPQCADAGPYDVVITNIAGSIISPPGLLTVVTPPIILVQPTNIAVLVGQTATLQTTATNDCGGGLSYQWLFATAYLPNATNSTLLIPNAQHANSGNYSVIVADLAGSVTSSVAVVTVVDTFSPTILSPTLAGTNLTFSFQSIAGKTYLVQYKNDFQDASWQTLQTIPGDGTLKSVVTPVSTSPRRFYRLSVQ